MGPTMPAARSSPLVILPGFAFAAALTLGACRSSGGQRRIHLYVQSPLIRTVGVERR